MSNNKDIAIKNISYMASTIGHEIGHAFDTIGSLYNSDGKLENLWTDEDLAQYKKRADKLSSVFDCALAYADLNAKKAYYQAGNQVINEAMADIGGNEAALVILKKLYPDDASVIKDFYRYTAQQ